MSCSGCVTSPPRTSCAVGTATSRTGSPSSPRVTAPSSRPLPRRAARRARSRARGTRRRAPARRGGRTWLVGPRPVPCGPTCGHSSSAGALRPRAGRGGTSRGAPGRLPRVRPARGSRTRRARTPRRGRHETSSRRSRSISMTSWRVRTSSAKRSRSCSGVCRRSVPRSGIVPPTW